MAKKTKKEIVTKKVTKTVEQPEMMAIADGAIKVPSIPEQEETTVERLKPRNEWEVKDRVYFLKGRHKPLSFMIKSAGIYWFDEEKGYERELKYCENQRTPFVDEMQGDQRLSHIVFRDGMLVVPKNKTVLQKLLSLYHPHINKLFHEYNPVEIAENETANLELEVDALLAAREMDIDMAEAIMRTEIGSKVAEMSSKELRRDLLIFAKKNPKLLLDLADDDNVQLRNFGIRATEAGILRLSQDQRYFMWGSNGRKLMNVPFDEHPYSALAHWFKTDEGMEVYSNIEKRLK
jgi:hypothetical protein